MVAARQGHSIAAVLFSWPDLPSAHDGTCAAVVRACSGHMCYVLTAIGNRSRKQTISAVHPLGYGT